MTTSFERRFGFPRAGVDLSNWRTRPFSAWSFQNVGEFVPSADIASGLAIEEDEAEPLGDLLALPAGTQPDETVGAFLKRSETDSLTIFRSGRLFGEWASPTCDVARPHLIFSISKSLTAIVAGILEMDGLLDRSRSVSHYVPEARGSAFEDATVQQLLDMRVSLDFEETYLDPDSMFARYRRAMLWNPLRPGDPVETLASVLFAIGKGAEDHGGPFRYRSPCSDVLGIVIERASGERLPELLKTRLLGPIGARGAAQIAVDGVGTARAAGGVSMTARDLARVGEMMRNGGMAGSRAVLSEAFVRDTTTGGDPDAWKRGDFNFLMPDGSYRNKWYQSGQPSGAFLGIGIHGQWLYVDPTRETVIVKFSSQTLPVDDALDKQCLSLFSTLSAAL
jgi:CubicO group peptidase (beta-lactamase class C family)